ncbi:hypothetical protein ACFZCK_11290 [Kitasatospora purpeofusca]|uniref:hypothetical protein n=1 Tax=Kitasatospora purpeofusca TaxID=67352 RepID=UPI0036E6A28D
MIVIAGSTPAVSHGAGGDQHSPSRATRPGGKSRRSPQRRLLGATHGTAIHPYRSRRGQSPWRSLPRSRTPTGRCGALRAPSGGPPSSTPATTLVLDQTGSAHKAFLARLPEDAVVFAYYRADAPAGEATRTKFALISWIGENTSPLKKGKVSVDRSQVKQVVKDITAELATSDPQDLALERIQRKIGSGNY